jgi:hypothetical protein
MPPRTTRTTATQAIAVFDIGVMRLLDNDPSGYGMTLSPSAQASYLRNSCSRSLISMG